MKIFFKILGVTLLFANVNLAHAEPYIAASLGWGFDQKLKSVTGDENLNYSGPIIDNGTFFRALNTPM